MSAQKVQQAMNLAVSHHQAGRFAEAEPIYRQVLAAQPNNPEALHLLGVLNAQIGRHEIAADLIQKAITASPRNPTYLGNLGLSLLQLARFDQAAAVYQQLIALQPANASAHYFLGNVHFARGEVAAAIASYERSLALRPVNFDALHNLGNALVSNRQYEQAITVCRRAIQMNPNFAGTHNNLGNALKNAGKLDEAIASYQNAIVLDQTLAEAHNNLGNTLQDKKELDLAIASYRRAIEINPNNPEFLCNLGSALMTKNQPEQAAVALNQSLALDPGFVRSLYNLGSLSSAQNKSGQAIDYYKLAVELKPDYFEAWLNLGLAYTNSSQPAKGIECLEHALAVKPDSAEVHNAIGINWFRLGKFDQAIASHLRALELKPEYLEAIHNLGNAVKENGDLPNAIRCYLRASSIDPNHFGVLYSLGMAWKEGGNLDESISCLNRALAIEPGDANTIGGLASAYQDAGQLDRAIGYYRLALEIDPNRIDTHEGLLYGLLYSGDAQSVAAEHRRWNANHAQHFIEKTKPFTNNRDPNRRIRLAYISGDFRRHSVNHFIQPLLEAHDKDAFELFCYANVPKPDAVTEHLKSNIIPNWRNIVGMDDDEIADLIREDQIDILVDLAGHSAHNKLLMMAQKPAPVQVNYQGYAATTGLTAIDYRITDIYSDPPGLNESHCSEKLVHLPQTAWVYLPPDDATPVSPLPALSTGTITFGSNNYFGKLSNVILDCWMQVLIAVPNSRLIIKAKGSTTRVSRERIEGFMSRHQVASDRVQLIDYIPSAEHFQHFSKIDIALDSYPYNGTTTTCETLWMGIPVITLYGEGHVSRVGYSLMTNIGLPQLTAQTTDQFVAAAKELASDLPRLADLRSGMRQRMINSPIMDRNSLARNMEALYRMMWKNWCGS